MSCTVWYSAHIVIQLHTLPASWTVLVADFDIGLHVTNFCMA